MKTAHVQSLLPILLSIKDSINATPYTDSLQAETGYRFARAGINPYDVAEPGIQANLFPQKKEYSNYQDRYNKLTLTPVFPESLVI